MLVPLDLPRSHEIFFFWEGLSWQQPLGLNPPPLTFSESQPTLSLPSN